MSFPLNSIRTFNITLLYFISMRSNVCFSSIQLALLCVLLGILVYVVLKSDRERERESLSSSRVHFANELEKTQTSSYCPLHISICQIQIEQKIAKESISVCASVFKNSTATADPIAVDV